MNPYLAAAAVLAAGLDGVEQQHEAHDQADPRHHLAPKTSRARRGR